MSGTVIDRSSTSTGDGTVGLRWLLARPELGLRPVYLPDGDPALSWAHAIELEDPSPWLRGAGLVLTTGLRLPRSRAGQAAYVARLVAAGARALGFGTGFRFAGVPPGVLEACQDLGLPLVEVPLPTPFLGVVQAVSDRLGEQRRQRLQEALATQQQLTRDALRGGAPAVTRSLARALSAGVLVLDPDLGVLARAGSRPPTIAAVAAETRGRSGAVSVSTPGSTLEIQPLGDRPTHPAGWLALRRPTPPSSTERVVLSQAVSLLTLELVRGAGPAVPRVIGGAEAALVRAAVTAERGVWPADPLRAVLEDLGFGGDDDVALLGLRAEREEAVARALTSARRSSALLAAPWTWDGASGVLALVPGSAVPDGGGAPARFAAEAVAVGVGRRVRVADLPGTLGAVRRAVSRAGPGEVVHAAHLPLEVALADLGPALGTATQPWLARLGEHDAVHGTGLVAALGAFLDHHGALDPAARALGVHRHTLRHRVDRAAEVAGCDLADPTHRALLVLALADPAQMARDPSQKVRDPSQMAKPQPAGRSHAVQRSTAT